MAWDDPAPARGGRPGQPRSQRQSPGYGAANSLPFLTILSRGVVALCLGVASGAATHAALVAWHVAHRGGLAAMTQLALSVLVAAVIGVVALLYLLSRPRSAGLPLSVRDGGGGWWSRRRGWDDGYGYPTFGQQVAAEIAADVVGAAIDAIVD